MEVQTLGSGLPGSGTIILTYWVTLSILSRSFQWTPNSCLMGVSLSYITVPGTQQVFSVNTC